MVVFEKLTEKTFREIARCLEHMIFFENTIHSPKANCWSSTHCSLKTEVDWCIDNFTDYRYAFDILMFVHSIQNNLDYYFEIKQECVNGIEKYHLALKNIVKGDRPDYIELVTDKFIDDFKFARCE